MATCNADVCVKVFVSHDVLNIDILDVWTLEASHRKPALQTGGEEAGGRSDESRCIMGNVGCSVFEFDPH